jgi:hypothetical protein
VPGYLHCLGHPIGVESAEKKSAVREQTRESRIHAEATAVFFAHLGHAIGFSQERTLGEPNALPLVGEPAGQGGDERHLGFSIGPLALDSPDEEVKQLIESAFSAALATDLALALHLDDSKFWDSRRDLRKAENLEWLDWKKTPNTGRSLAWSSRPLKVAPELCLSSPAVRAAVAARLQLIGEAVAKGRARLRSGGRDYLFAGVIAGWETQIDPDHESGKPLGYCALIHRGYGEAHPPPDPDLEREEEVKEFIRFMTEHLHAAGLEEEKIYSHSAFLSRRGFEIRKERGELPPGLTYSSASHFSTAASAFGAGHRPGFSLYPAPGALQEVKAELSARGNPAWALAEGAAIDPAKAESGKPGVSPESYLAAFFSNGAVLVNLFGWGVGPPENPFRKAAESPEALAAYRRWLRGEALQEGRDAFPEIPSAAFFAKVKRLQAVTPERMRQEPARFAPIMKEFEYAVKAEDYSAAEKLADTLLAK